MTNSAAIKGGPRRTELAEFLRSRRERITPEAAGLPPAPRRRTPGLRREEVAQLTGVGVTWYTWLEQGRPINASTHVLDAIARTLKMDLTEHQHLYTLAHVPDVKLAAPPSEVPPEALEILEQMGHMATVANERFDVLATNAAFDALFPRAMIHGMDRHNTLLCTLFTHAECCHPFVNWRETIVPMVAALRASYARHIGEPSWDDFINGMIADHEYFAELWARNEVAAFGQQPGCLYHPMVGNLRFTAMSFGIHGAPGLRMQVFVPVDEETRIAQRRLLDGTAQAPEVLPCGHTWEEWLAVVPGVAAPK